MKITAQDLHNLGIIDEVIPEPVGGAHRAREKTMAHVGDALESALADYDNVPGERLRKAREAKFLAIGRDL